MATLGDLAKLVRSKNAGPFWLTIDIMFDDAAAYRRARDAEIVNRASIARLYNSNPANIIVVNHATALAIKVSFSRPQSDLLAKLAEELCFEMSFAPGDIQFVNNHVIYHARSAFEDDDEGHDRLLLRLWLSMPNSRTLPAGHEVLWRAIEAGALRGGIGQSGVPV